MKILEITLILLIIFLGGVFVQESFSQNLEIPSRDKWEDKSREVLQEYVDDTLQKNGTIVKNSIKTRISATGEDVLPPRIFARIIYDIVNNKNIQHIDSIYKINFGQFALTPDNAELVKIFESEYQPPKKIKSISYRGETPEMDNTINFILRGVICRQGFENLIKISDESQVCVKSKSMSELIDRGWGSIFPKEIRKSMFKVANTEFYIQYYIINGKLLSASLDDENNSIILSVMLTGDGTLKVKFPRIEENHECLTDNMELYLQSDGKKISWDEKLISPVERTLKFKLANGTKEIEIMGKAMCHGMPMDVSPFLK